MLDYILKYSAIQASFGWNYFCSSTPSFLCSHQWFRSQVKEQGGHSIGSPFANNTL